MLCFSVIPSIQASLQPVWSPARTEKAHATNLLTRALHLSFLIGFPVYPGACLVFSFYYRLFYVHKYYIKQEDKMTIYRAIRLFTHTVSYVDLVISIHAHSTCHHDNTV